MKLFHKMSILVSLATAAFAGEYTVGPSNANVFELKGKVQALYVKGPDIFFVKIRDPDGSAVWAWVKGNNAALATFLAEKASGGTVGIIYSKMADSNDNTVNCYDIPYVTWVCRRLNWVETVE
jgi:hypothetical protein